MTQVHNINHKVIPSKLPQDMLPLKVMHRRTTIIMLLEPI
jgi:hypothetical protein